jgi:hypothetical protein
MELMNRARKSTFALLLIIVGGLLLVIFTFTISYPVNFMEIVVIWVFCGGAVGIAYLTTVKFHSPICLTEDETYTTFNGRTEVVYDKEWDAHLGIVFVNGYNAAKRVLSKDDISTSRATTLLVAPSPFMIETFANGRFIIARGKPRQLSRQESQAFLDRPSIQAALGGEDGEVRSATVHWLFASTSMHADEVPTDVSTLGDLTATLQKWHGEVAGSAEIFGEEFQRDLKVIKRFRESPLESMAREKEYQKKEGEKSDE